ncbi:TetR family transcriptional regulator, partial [Nocardia neocaledoniensis]|uniref:TetR family transcriptional regulator n=1 Tax=Nocardia neocaledoniensis TaxID=236511 RepID=UPI002457DBD0
MSTDRRALIVTVAIELIATRGIRALTHRALDTALALPAGSTSYYFRTRQALIAAVAHGITARSHADFAEMRTAHGGSATDQAGRGEPTTARGEAAPGAGGAPGHARRVGARGG